MATGKQQVKRALQPHLYFLIYAQLHACLEGNSDVYGDIAAYVFWAYFSKLSIFISCR